MNRMSDSGGSKASRDFLRLVVFGAEFQRAMRKTPEARKVIDNRNKLTDRILKAVEQAETIEDLIEYEVALQRLDEYSAHDPQDIASIQNAQRDYRQLSETISQMRRNPEEYLRANMGMHDTGGDIRKMPRGRIQQIHSNATRLRNRAAFSPEEERRLWDARILLAEKTADMLRGMHDALVEKHEQQHLP